MKKIAIAILMIASTNITSAETGWIHVASSKNNDSKWEAQKGSFEFSKTKNGTPIAVVVGKVTDNKTSNIDLYKWYVSATDCAKKMGKVVSTKVSGEFDFENDFVFGGGNISSAMAEFICSVADYVTSENNKKSL